MWSDFCENYRELSTDFRVAMETRRAVSDVAINSGVRAANSGEGAELQTGKRMIKMTVKALAAKCDKFQADRKGKLNRAASIRDTIKGFMVANDKFQVQNALAELVQVCDDARGMHENLLGFMAPDEKEKQNIWFKAKMLSNNECISQVQMWVSNNEGGTYGGNDDGINPNDSVSNVMSKCSSGKSVKSSTSSAARVAEAERAALVARAAALKERHVLEEQEQQLRRKREQLDMEAEIAATNAKLSVLYASDGHGSAQTPSNAMNSYLDRERRKMEPVKALDPSAKEFQPWKSMDKHDLMQSQSKQMMVRPKECIQWSKPVVNVQHSHNYKEQVKIKMKTPQQSHGQSARVWLNEETQPTNPPQNDSAQNNPNQIESIQSIMQRQNEITAALVQQQRSSSLPPRDIPVFDGDPLQYRAFIKAFEQGVEQKTTHSDSLYYLKQFTRGQPQELVRSCQHMAPERGYIVAKGLLLEHFGNHYKVADAYIRRALAWQTIKSLDVKTLQSYSLFLRRCCNVMEELHYMQELDMPVNMRAIMSKLPFKMRE